MRQALQTPVTHLYSASLANVNETAKAQNSRQRVEDGKRATKIIVKNVFSHGTGFNHSWVDEHHLENMYKAKGGTRIQCVIDLKHKQQRTRA